MFSTFLTEIFVKKLIAANWKMHKTRAEARDLIKDIVDGLHTKPAINTEIVIFPPYTALDASLASSEIALGAQNVYPAEQGAFTGEISTSMLQDVGCTWVLTGHSERRHILGESSIFIGKKTAFALEHGLSVILCIGETLEEREMDLLQSVLYGQIEDALYDIKDFSHLVIAYEPVWAIGTGKVASADDIRFVHALVRGHLQKICGKNHIRILYGGSVKPENATEILKIDNVNGLLVGGASLQAGSFLNIVHAAQ